MAIHDALVNEYLTEDGAIRGPVHATLEEARAHARCLMAMGCAIAAACIRDFRTAALLEVIPAPETKIPKSA